MATCLTCRLNSQIYRGILTDPTGSIDSTCPTSLTSFALRHTPVWAKPLVEAALRLMP